MIRKHAQFGMTLVEAMLVVGVFTLISISLFTSIQSLYQNNSYTFAQADEVNHARRGIYALSQDMREMTYGEDGTFPVVVKDDNRIGFYSDIDKDDSVEYVEYEIATTTLYKYVFNPTGNPPVYDLDSPDQAFILSEYVQNVSQGTSTFYYYDTNNTPLSTSSLLTDVRYIKTQLIINIDPLRSPGEFMLRSSIAPRNLKDNL
jgi:type II secretory pathway pseudopilin PulG